MRFTTGRTPRDGYVSGRFENHVDW